MATSSSIAKSGWLYRQSSVLKKWRRYWFTLTQDGYFRYFETELSTKAEDVINIPIDCTSIKVGSEVHKIHPPEGLNGAFLFAVDTRNGRTWVMCGENEDDTKAWQLALQEARLIRHYGRSPSAPPPGVFVYGTPAPVTVVADDSSVRYAYGYPGSTVTYAVPGNAYYPTYPAIHVPGNTTVVYNRNPYYYRPGTDLAFGMLAGAALGSLMWTPFLWWW